MAAPDTIDLDQRFDYHRPDEQKKAEHQDVRTVMKQAAEDVMSLVPSSRERSLALTKLEEAMFWCNAAIARY